MHRPFAAALLSLALLPMGAAGQAPQRLFYSGHSLLDDPLPGDVAAIAASLGTPLQWSRQHLEGSSIRERNAALDVLAEWRAPRVVQGGMYDTLIVTEQHTLVGNLVWNDSVRELRRVHERFIASNARGQTWFYASWLNLDNRDDPRRWITYERAASQVWQCLATRINTSLAAEGRPDRIAFLPAGALLAALVERATQGPVIAGVSAVSPRATIERLFRDDVHLSPLGSFFMSSLVYATLYGRSPAGAAVAEGIDDTAARALQSVAWDLVQQERTQRETLSLDACRERTQHFIAPYTAYVRDVVVCPAVGAPRAWLQWTNHRRQFMWALRSGAKVHPLRFDAATDKAYWLAPP